MSIELWEAAYLFTTLEMEKRFPGVLFKSPRHLVNIWGVPFIGEGTEIGAFVEIGDDARIGRMCKIGAFTFIPPCVTIGDGVFVGPRVTFMNDRYPPSPRGEWLRTFVKDGAVLGAASAILPGVTVGEGAIIGAGAVVTKDVPAGETWVGNPAKEIKRV